MDEAVHTSQSCCLSDYTQIHHSALMTYNVLNIVFITVETYEANAAEEDESVR